MLDPAAAVTGAAAPRWAVGAVIPATYTDYLEVQESAAAWLYPGLGADLTGTPYFVVRCGALI